MGCRCILRPINQQRYHEVLNWTFSNLPPATFIRRRISNEVRQIGSGRRWSPRRRFRFQYYLPADVYETLVSTLVPTGGAWIDVGGGHDIFPENPRLAQTLAQRAGLVVGVDPSDNILRNPFVHERHQALIEDFVTDQQFDLATLRMVVEHVVNPPVVVAALRKLIRPGGYVVILTVNRAVSANLRTPAASSNQRLFGRR